MHDAPQLVIGDPPHRRVPRLDPRSEWRAQAEREFRRGYMMLAVSACGLIAVIAFVPSNVLEATFQSNPPSGVTTSLKITAIASVCLFMILAIFFEGVRALARGRHLEDKLTRWPTAFIYRDQLTAQEHERLIELGPRGEPQAAKQLELFTREAPLLRAGWLNSVMARIRG